MTSTQTTTYSIRSSAGARHGIYRLTYRSLDAARDAWAEVYGEDRSAVLSSPVSDDQDEVGRDVREWYVYATQAQCDADDDCAAGADRIIECYEDDDRIIDLASECARDSLRQAGDADEVLRPWTGEMLAPDIEYVHEQLGRRMTVSEAKRFREHFVETWDAEIAAD